eukprot:275552-Rhodomonas_salina.2
MSAGQRIAKALGGSGKLPLLLFRCVDRRPEYGFIDPGRGHSEPLGSRFGKNFLHLRDRHVDLVYLKVEDRCANLLFCRSHMTEKPCEWVCEEKGPFREIVEHLAILLALHAYRSSKCNVVVFLACNIAEMHAQVKWLYLDFLRLHLQAREQ